MPASHLGLPRAPQLPWRVCPDATLACLPPPPPATASPPHPTPVAAAAAAAAAGADLLELAGRTATPTCTLHPAPCTLHPATAPCTLPLRRPAGAGWADCHTHLHPAPCTLHPATAQTCWSWLGCCRCLRCAASTPSSASSSPAPLRMPLMLTMRSSRWVDGGGAWGGLPGGWLRGAGCLPEWRGVGWVCVGGGRQGGCFFLSAFWLAPIPSPPPHPTVWALRPHLHACRT